MYGRVSSIVYIEMSGSIFFFKFIVRIEPDPNGIEMKLMVDKTGTV